MERLLKEKIDGLEKWNAAIDIAHHKLQKYFNKGFDNDWLCIATSKLHVVILTETDLDP